MVIAAGDNMSMNGSGEIHELNVDTGAGEPKLEDLIFTSDDRMTEGPLNRNRPDWGCCVNERESKVVAFFPGCGIIGLEKEQLNGRIEAIHLHGCKAASAIGSVLGN